MSERTSLPEEPHITINGKPLSFGEAMTIRVAVSTFLAELTTDGLGDGEMGKQISEGYIAACKSILAKMALSKQKASE